MKLFTLRVFVALPQSLREWSSFFSGTQIKDRSTPINGLYTGEGSPEGVVTAIVGSLYARTDGGAGTTLYVKESGVSDTGWAAK